MLKPRVDILLSEYERLKEYEKENQRLKENNQTMQEEMVRTWKKYDEVNNVLTELEKWLNEESQNEYHDIDYRDAMIFVLDKLKELKESDK